jgi:threonine dehydrogenase-like Zn-dependent dehydrogenase
LADLEKAVAVFGYHDKVVSFDFSSWDPLPWVESWQISFYGTEGILHSRPLPANCDLFLKENGTTIGISLDGGFTRFVKAPQKALHPIREDVPLKEAVWGELLSCVLGSTERIRIQPGQVGVVIGAGPAGILHGMLFKAAGAKVIIADVATERLNYARSAGIDIARYPR